MNNENDILKKILDKFMYVSKRIEKFDVYN